MDSMWTKNKGLVIVSDDAATTANCGVILSVMSIHTIMAASYTPYIL